MFQFQIVTRLVYTERVSPKQINVMSQYNAQCHTVRQHFRSNGFTQDIVDVSVNTVVASQGNCFNLSQMVLHTKNDKQKLHRQWMALLHNNQCC